MYSFFRQQVIASIEIKQSILNDSSLIGLIEAVCKKAVAVYQNGKKIITAGNGGSAGDAQHIAGELVNSFYFKRPGLPAIALTTDTSVLTSIANDESFSDVFSRQIQANGSCGDMFIGITTSGNSQNIINAIHECRKKNIVTVCLTGLTGGKVAELCDFCIKVPSKDTPRIQEAHILISHLICAAIEKQIFSGVC